MKLQSSHLCPILHRLLEFVVIRFTIIEMRIVAKLFCSLPILYILHFSASRQLSRSSNSYGKMSGGSEVAQPKIHY